MAKSDTPLQEIDLSRAYSPPQTPKWAEDTDINAFDTETADGTIFLLTAAWENGSVDAFPTNGPRPITNGEIWDIITNRKARSSLNVWYNLSFDADAILSTVLDKEDLARISITGSVETENYEITYIPSKFLEIADKNGHTWTHYDIAQFFYTSLDNAVDEWLDTEKLTETVDTTKFGQEDNKINQYIHDNYPQILRYAKRDAAITRDLWKKAVNVGESLDIPMGRPYSTGYLAESYLNEHLGHKPGLGPKEMRRMAWDAYAGGRFEVIKRGYIGPVSGPDINSAYPYILANLPDPKTLVWEHNPNATIEEISQADFGFVKATVTTDKTRAIQPFAVKMKGNTRASNGGKLKYPALQNETITTIKPIFELAYNHDYLLDYEIHDTWLASESMHADFPFGFIPSLYNTRKQYESESKFKLALWLKIVLNSMYGKTCQTTPKRAEIPEDTTLELEDYQTYVNEMQIPADLRDTFNAGIVETLQAGAWFNPFIASYITGMTRYELHKRILEYGLEDNTVMMATDSLMIEQKPFEQSDFADDLVKSGLGNWDYDYQGKATVVGAGVYEIDTGNEIKTKTRGFEEADLDGSLRKEMQRANGTIEINSTRPITAAEAIWHNQKLADVANFTEFDRKIFPDMDDKRRWNGPASFSAFLEETQASKPLVL